MKPILATLALCALAACGSSSGSSSGATTTVSSMNASVAPTTLAVAPPPSVPRPSSFEGMLNNVRASNGAGSVRYDARLGRAARGHANDMLANNYFSHTGRDGSSVGDRVRAQGYDWRTVGENIARGQRSEQEVFEGWSNSPGHHRNNINPNFEDFALAKAGSGRNTYWVLVLAAER